MRILLINQYSGNKGDRAVLYAMCRLLKSIYRDVEITVSTSDPELWNGYKYYSSEGIRFVPWGWDYDRVKKYKFYWRFLNRFKKYTFTLLRESFMRNVSLARFLANPEFKKALKQSSVVISVGGHHFTTMLSRDLVSSINFDAMVASSYRRIICFSQSFGPFDFHNPKNRLLTQRLLSNSILMPREEKSVKEIHTFLGKEEAEVIPTYESVLTLANHIQYLPIEQRDNAVGIAIYCTQSRTVEERKHYQQTIADFCNYVIDKGYSIRFFPMEIKGSAPDDRGFIAEIIAKVLRADKCFIYEDDMETLEHLEEVSKCKIFLGHKTHSTIFALATGTPLIALAYHPKTIKFLQQFDMALNAIDDKQLSIQALIQVLDRLNTNLDEISQLEFNRSQEKAKKISSDLMTAINILSR